MPLPINAGDVFSKSRVLLNDVAGAVYPDTILLPFLQMAYEDLRLECEDNNIPFTNKTSAAITIPAGIKGIGGSGQPPLPVDLVEIVEMYERIAGTTNDYMQMYRREFLPKTEQETTYLQVYVWQEQQVKFVGANGDIEVKIDYIANTLNNIIDANSQIRIFNCLSFLYFRTAGLASRFIDENETRADSLDGQAIRCIETMENIGVKNKQSMPVRRRPFMSAYRQRGWQGGNW